MVEATARFRVSKDEEPGIPRVENARVTPEDVKAGEPFTVTYQLRNEGSGPMTGTAVIEFTCAGGACIPQKRMVTKTVQAKGTMPETAQFTMPPNATPGTYSVQVRYEQNTAPGGTTFSSYAPVRSEFTAKNATIS